jgi:hypothetical protein
MGVTTLCVGVGLNFGMCVSVLGGDTMLMGEPVTSVVNVDDVDVQLVVLEMNLLRMRISMSTQLSLQ